MTKRDWLHQAEEIDQRIANLLSEGEDGSYILVINLLRRVFAPESQCVPSAGGGGAGGV